MAENFKLCPECRGAGKVMHPAFRGEAFTREDFDNDPDFERRYFGGDLDVTCEVCNGLRVVEDTPDAAQARQDDREAAAERDREYLMMGGLR